MLYQTYKRMIIREEEDRLEKLKMHKMGCSEKCRVKNTMLDLDLKRNQELVDQLMHFKWCESCASFSENTDQQKKDANG
jgi:hypothetical protein